MKKLFLTFAIFLLSAEIVSAGSFVYPFDMIAKPSCRFSVWGMLGGDCKMTMPRIEKADYPKYKTDTSYRRIYSVLYGSTYTYGWDVWFGSHQGVDIATSQGTPVRSIGDGEVISASWQNGWWNTVSIKHRLANGTYIYSNYAHLSKITTTRWPIKVGTTIGEVGNTGNSYGNHLHFQIDTTDQAHPYYYVTCAKGKNPMTIVDQWLCRDYLTANTIDPIAFLESNGEFTTIENLQQKTKTAPKIEQRSIKTREQILEEETDEFFKRRALSVSLWIPGNNIEVGKTYTARITVTENGKPFTGSLPGDGLVLSYDNKGVRLFPDIVIAIENGTREFKISGLKVGKYGISFKIGKKIFLTTNVNLYKATEMRAPTQAAILVNPSLLLAQEKLMAVVFRTKYGSNQIDIPYYGTYILKSLTGKAKFCNVSQRKVRKCSAGEVVEELTFTYDDTYRGVLIANIVPLDFMPVSLVVIKKETGKTLAKTATDINIRNPNRIDKSYTYFTEVISALKKWIHRLQSGYVLQEREIIGKQAKEMVRNYLAYTFLRAWSDKALKNQIATQIRNSESIISSIDDYIKMTRGNFARLVLDVLDPSLIVNTDKKWIDESGAYKDIITTLRLRYDFKWRDNFGERYFQPDKNLTIGEALYLIEQIDKKGK